MMKLFSQTMAKRKREENERSRKKSPLSFVQWSASLRSWQVWGACNLLIYNR
jgi:hypothetical protein